MQYFYVDANLLYIDAETHGMYYFAYRINFFVDEMYGYWKTFCIFADEIATSQYNAKIATTLQRNLTP